MSAQEFKDLGNKAFQAGQYHEAIDHYSNAIALDENHVFYSNRSGAYAALNRWAEALEDADSCISTNPSFAKGYARRAAALVGMGHHKDAASAYQEALKIDPQNPTYQDELRACAAAVQKASSPPQQQQQQQQQQQSPFGGMGGMDDMFNPFGPQMIAKLEANPQTKQLLQSRATREALEDISKNPQNLSRHTDNPAVMMCLQSLLGITPEMQMKMAQEEHEREQQQKAREDQLKSRPRYTAPAMERDTTPTQPAPVEEDVEVDEELEKERRERKEKREQADKIKEQGAVEYKAKKFDDAIALFKQANEVDDSNPTYLMNIAACYFELKNYPQCISACKDALGASGPVSSSQKAKIYGRMANAHLKSNEFQLAIDCFKRSLLEENSPQLRQQLRAAEQAFKQFQIESYYDDEKSEIAKNEGNTAFAAAEYGKAIDLYTDALKRNPKNYKVYSNRALCYIKVCAWEKALEDCDKCLSFDPKFIKAMIRKGKVLHFLKSYHKAIEIFREALEIDPNNEELLEAMAATQRAIYSSPSDPAAQEARMAEAMKDPEIQLAMANPRIQKLLDDMQKDPNAAMAAFQNPEVAPLLEKLIAAGIIRLG